MKIVVLTEALTLNRTSEGICSSKFILALRHAGHEIICLSSESQFIENTGRFFVPWLPDIPIIYVYYNKPKLKASFSLVDHHLFTHPTGLWLIQKYLAAWTYVTGWNLEDWNRIKMWVDILDSTIEEEKPDLVFVRGAGQSFFPHLAMTKISKKIPWIANYHDPFPLSLYPEPYRKVRWLLSWRQEVWNEKILAKATKITFPSQRLLNWMLSGKLLKYRDKATVIPHLAMDLPSYEGNKELPDELIINPDHFTLVHTGNLLEARQPWALFTAFKRIASMNSEFSRTARIYQVGKIHSKHKKDARWQEILSMPQAHIFEGLHSYQDALLIAKTSSVLILLEAATYESPFFPAKLADYLWIRKPILTLTTVHSTSADLLGKNHILRADPDDVDGIQEKILRLWIDWKNGKISESIDPDSTLEPLTESLVMVEINKLLNSVLRFQ